MVAPLAGVYYNDTAAGSFFSEILREQYQPGVIETLNNSNFLYQFLPRAGLMFQGKHWVFALHTGRSAGHSAIGPGGRLPDPGKQSYARWRGPVRHHFGRIQLDALTDLTAKGGDASFMASAMDAEIRGIVSDMDRQKNRMVHLDGSGRLAQVNGNVVASATVVVKLPQVPESPGTMTGLNATHWLHEGMRIAFVDPAGPTVVDADVIQSVDSATQITMAAVVTVDDNDWLCTNATATGTDRVSTGFKREPMGFAGIFSDTNPECYDTADNYDSSFTLDSFQNVDADDTSNGFARATIMDNGGVKRPPTEMLLIRTMTAATRRNNANISFLLSAPEVQDAYGELLLSDRRFMNTTSLSGGWTALDFRGKPWVTDRDCLPNRIYAPDMGYIAMGQLEDYHWETRTGMLQQLEDYDEYHARIKGRWNMVCTLRDKQTLITDLDDTL